MQCFRPSQLPPCCVHHETHLVSDVYGVCLEQEAQLSQRGCAALRVIRNFAKSLNVTQDYSKLHH